MDTKENKWEGAMSDGEKELILSKIRDDQPHVCKNDPCVGLSDCRIVGWKK